MTNISKNTAIRLANICLWAYDFDESKKQSRLNFAGEDPIKTIQVQDEEKKPTSYAGIVEYEKFIVVAFQGTITDVAFDGNFSYVTLKDWTQNLKAKLIDSEKTGLPGGVHFGFHKQLNLIYGKVKTHLTPSSKPLIITGHSQGGAVAVLATKKLELDGFEVQQTYTFGAPRPGSESFATSITTPVFRVEYGRDLVPHLPPTLKHDSPIRIGLDFISNWLDVPERYHSVGDLTYGTEEGELLTNLDSTTEVALSTERRDHLRDAGKALASHHGLANYIGMFK